MRLGIAIAAILALSSAPALAQTGGSGSVTGKIESGASRCVCGTNLGTMSAETPGRAGAPEGAPTCGQLLRNLADVRAENSPGGTTLRISAKNASDVDQVRQVVKRMNACLSGTGLVLPGPSGESSKGSGNPPAEKPSP